MTTIFHFKKGDWLPSKKLYLLRAGFQGVENKLDHNMLNLTNEIYLEAISLVHPKLFYQTVSVQTIRTITIPKQFEGISDITFFCSTLGGSIEKRIEAYSLSGETTKGALLDAWGSESLEALNDQFDKHLHQTHKKGTMRFSPGYSDVPLSENKRIIDFLHCPIVQAHPKSGMLIPQKSTVCMIGWY